MVPMIQELIKDLEEKGIKPVIAVNGEVKKLTLIHERELQDFYKILEENGEEKNNFCVVEADKTDYSSTFYTKTGNAIVVCKTSGKIREYHAGNNSKWLAEFVSDLNNNFFK